MVKGLKRKHLTKNDLYSTVSERPLSVCLFLCLLVAGMSKGTPVGYYEDGASCKFTGGLESWMSKEVPGIDERALPPTVLTGSSMSGNSMAYP